METLVGNRNASTARSKWDNGCERFDRSDGIVDLDLIACISLYLKPLQLGYCARRIDQTYNVIVKLQFL
jgi:hypothetical protein